MKRRIVLKAFMAAALGTPFASLAQTVKPSEGSPRRVAVLAPSTREQDQANLKPFFDAMSDLGWIEGHSVTYDRRYAGDEHARLPALAAELLKRNPEVIFAPTVVAALAAARATHTTPVVFSVVGDPVGLGLVKSLARPGGNVTGVIYVAQSLSPKRLEILKEILPKAVRIGLAFDPNDESSQLDRRAIEEARARFGFVWIDAPVGKPQDLDAAIAGLLKKSPDAVVMLSGALLFNLRHRLLELTARTKRPVVASNNQVVVDGALFSYGPSFEERIRRGAYYVDRILKGASPADLPVEQLSTLQLVINLKTAQALGITIPKSILFRADRLIE